MNRSYIIAVACIVLAIALGAWKISGKPTHTAQVYRGIVVNTSHNGLCEPVYITGADSLIVQPTDTVMVDAEGYISHEEEPDHMVVLGVYKGTIQIGSAK